MRKIDKHIVHCSDSTHGNVEEIRRWHLARGWSDIGYHFVILPDGTLEIGRPLNKVGAHTVGYNKGSVGTCLTGRTEFRFAQMNTLKILHVALSAMSNGLTSHGHCEFNPHKSCPNFEVSEVLG